MIAAIIRKQYTVQPLRVRVCVSVREASSCTALVRPCVGGVQRGKGFPLRRSSQIQTLWSLEMPPLLFASSIIRARCNSHKVISCTSDEQVKCARFLSLLFPYQYESYNAEYYLDFVSNRKAEHAGSEDNSQPVLPLHRALSFKVSRVHHQASRRLHTNAEDLTKI